MKKKFLAIAGAALFAASMTANAVPLTVTAGESVIWNFNLSGQTPAPPYDAGTFNTNLDPSEFDFFDAGTWVAFSDLNGAGTQMFFGFVGLSSIGGDTPELFDLWGDGIWSVQFTMTSGLMIVDPCFIGRKNNNQQQTACIAGTLPGTTPVPEPATLALFSLGLAGLGLIRRRRPGLHR